MTSEPAGEPVPRPRANGFVCLVMLLFLSRGVLLCLALPYGDPLDEPFHFAYASFLWSTGGIPGSRTPSMAADLARPYRFLPWYAPFHDRTLTWKHLVDLPPDDRRVLRKRAFEDIPRERNLLVAPNYESQQPPLAYLLTGWPLLFLRAAPLSARLLVLRLTALIAATLALPAVFRLCRRIVAEDQARVLLVAIACFPGLGMFLGRYTNDSVAFLIVPLILLGSLRVLDDRISGAGAVGLGVLIGAGIWTKLYCLVLVPLPLLAGLLAPRGSRASAAKRGLLAGALALALAAPWAVRQKRDSGDLTGMTSTRLAGESGIGIAQAVAEVPKAVTRQFAVFYWRSFLWPGTWSASGAVKPARRILDFAILLFFLAALWGQRSTRDRRRRAVVMALAVLLFLAGQALHAGMFKAAADARGNGLASGGEGWYLLVLLPAVPLSASMLPRFSSPRSLRAVAALFSVADLLLVLGFLPLVYTDAATGLAEQAGAAELGRLLKAAGSAPQVLGAVGLGGSTRAIGAAAVVWLAVLAAALAAASQNLSRESP